MLYAYAFFIKGNPNMLPFFSSITPDDMFNAVRSHKKAGSMLRILDEKETRIWYVDTTEIQVVMYQPPEPVVDGN